jgi:RNA recognition motif-containing protein
VVVPITGDGLPVNLSKGAVVTEPRGLHVGNLPYDLTAEDLRRHLKNAGTIVLCEVPKGSNGKGKGYGIVLFKTVEEADCCIALFNKSILKGREINVRRDKFATRKFNVESA